ncbi:MAG: hypothetical protein LBM07_07880 [Culturomica sp.]|jgi:hypothetical protein|nr:hypothetical protein [Culturomica sp.]
MAYAKNGRYKKARLLLKKANRANFKSPPAISKSRRAFPQKPSGFLIKAGVLLEKG